MLQCAEAINAPFTPNFFAIPSVYNGRTSSLKITNTPIRRPWGVIQPTKNDQPTFAPSQRLDFELEMGVFISKPFPAGEILDIRRARDHIFGFVIMNDWSARDIQGFEIVPLGPFHSKGSGTSVSPWVVTVEALEGVKCGIGVERGERPLEHLRWKGNESEATFDIRLEARIISMFPDFGFVRWWLMKRKWEIIHRDLDQRQRALLDAIPTINPSNQCGRGPQHGRYLWHGHRDQQRKNQTIIIALTILVRY